MRQGEGDAWQEKVFLFTLTICDTETRIVALYCNKGLMDVLVCFFKVH